MSLASSTPWLRKAKQEGFALGAFNANTLEQLQAIVWAAEAASSPVIVQISRRAASYLGNGDVALGLRYAAEIAKVSADSVRVPVMLHFDHGRAEEVLLAARLGFTSVMFDGADMLLDDNIRETRRLCKDLQALGVGVEAEVGEVPRFGPEGAEQPSFTDPQQAADFVAQTGVNALAISIGSIHAVTEKHVRLDLDLLKAIRAKVDIPLVLHGSSGVDDEDIRAGVGLGLNKINIATQLNISFTEGLRSPLREDDKLVDPRPYLLLARQAMMERVRERIEFLGTDGMV